MIEKKWAWLRPYERVESALRQARDEGRALNEGDLGLAALKAQTDRDEQDRMALAVLDKIEQAPVRADYRYEEPTAYAAIAAAHFAVDEKDYESRLRGAWLGRAVGCLAGIPVEGWMRDRITGFLKATGNHPLRQYMSGRVEEEVRKEFGVLDADPDTQYDRAKICWIENVDGFPVDDDLNYTVAALRLLERYGRGFAPADAAESWLYALPALHTCTAERVAYQNLLGLIEPPRSGEYHNPYREFIGGQIRADLYGYANPGNPAVAAEMAWRDSVISHSKNGVYGAMYVAALLSVAAVAMPLRDKVAAALACVPPRSRLHERLAEVLRLHDAGQSFEDIAQMVHRAFDEADFFDWCHTLPNAMLVTAAVLEYGEQFDEAVAAIIQAGFDTDCNGATVGSFVGLCRGEGAIGPNWRQVKPVIHTSVSNYGCLSIEELAARTRAQTLFVHQ